MFQNTGAPFFHPVSHKLVETGTWYEGAAHLDHENSKPIEPEKEPDPPDDDKMNDQTGKEENDGDKAQDVLTKPEATKGSGGKSGSNKSK